ncbi:GNAT family N-acetyltransferase [Kineococcus sp. SYSU DK004]|uniref:GNAT family N-acetyltransferase n=1 Tax=Kineococcus sp. SYSU DK004 TaxID=3383125 RepID=UPI003D7EDFAB
MEIDRVPDPAPDDVLDGLADVLRDAVDDGASVGFPAVPDPAAARAWWAAWLAGGAWTWVARDPGGRLVGTVSLVPAGARNGAHRAELSKLLVHRDARGRGVASALVAAAEAEAARAGRWLLVLDTETGSAAESVYPRWGWRRVGTVDAYALSPRGVLTGTTFFTKTLPGAPPAPAEPEEHSYPAQGVRATDAPARPGCPSREPA